MVTDKIPPRLIFVVEPMCPWCYAMTFEIIKLFDVLRKELDFVVLMGGLQPYETKAMEAEARLKFERSCIKVKEEANIDMGNFALELPQNFIFDTEPASRALVAVRSMVPHLALAYLMLVQNAFFLDGKNITNPDVLAECAEGIGLESQAFYTVFYHEATRKATRGDFDAVKHIGVTSLPTVIFERPKGEEEYDLIAITRSHAKSEDMEEKIRNLLDAAQPQTSQSTSLYH